MRSSWPSWSRASSASRCKPATRSNVSLSLRPVGLQPVLSFWLNKF
jgi:hypothetical protein